ncbi:MAG: DUF4390 domain-containing protein [Betaproteobacteria bacterium]|nr:DUF4390 domain-containing protein [Betaproteobacteria bacterium]
MKTFLSLIAFAAASLAGPAAAQTSASPDIADLQVRKGDESFTVDMTYKLSLDDQLLAALAGGLQIPFVAELRFIELRQFWLDRSLKNYAWHAYISRPLPGAGYRFKRFADENEETAGSLEDALAELASLSLTSADRQLRGLLCTDRGMLQARIEVQLDLLPDPLQISVLTNSNWNFSSGWKVYPTANLGC